MNNETTKLTAPDITCGGCANSIKKALGAVAGIDNVDVDVATKEVTVEHAPTVTKDAIVETLDRAGFPTS